MLKPRAQCGEVLTFQIVVTKFVHYCFNLSINTHGLTNMNGAGCQLMVYLEVSLPRPNCPMEAYRPVQQAIEPLVQSYVSRYFSRVTQANRQYINVDIISIGPGVVSALIC